MTPISPRLPWKDEDQRPAQYPYDVQQGRAPREQPSELDMVVRFQNTVCFRAKTFETAPANSIQSWKTRRHPAPDVGVPAKFRGGLAALVLESSVPPTAAEMRSNAAPRHVSVSTFDGSCHSHQST